MAHADRRDRGCSNRKLDTCRGGQARAGKQHERIRCVGKESVGFQSDGRLLPCGFGAGIVHHRCRLCRNVRERFGEYAHIQRQVVTAIEQFPEGGVERSGRCSKVLRGTASLDDQPLSDTRPDLGRALDQASQSLLLAAKASFDCVFVVADGLSSIAAHRYALPVIAECLPLLKDLALGPIVFAHQSRVALGDAIGEALGARLCIMLIGERPGLSIADSLGAYITFDPKSGRRDSERNCVSNIHARGLNAGEAASTITWLVREALNRSVSGVALKDKQQTLRLPTG